MPLRYTTTHMDRLRKMGATALCFGTLLGSALAHSEPALMDRVDSVIDSVARGLSRVGEESEKWVEPALDLSADSENAAGSPLIPVSREYDESFPVGSGASISVSNEYGEIRVETWDNQVVHIVADISVGAETADIAGQIARATEIRVDHSPEHIEVRTIYPDTQGLGVVNKQVNCVLTVPKDAGVTCSNLLGDILVRGVGGALAVDARFGAVDIRDIGGYVQVRARGPFTLQAYNLGQGGTFDLRDTASEFHAVAGRLTVSNRMGSVELRDPAPETEADVRCESGPIRLYIDESSMPDVSAGVLFGSVESDFPLDRTNAGAMILARRANPESKQRFSLHTSFSQVSILQKGPESEEKPKTLKDGDLINRVDSWTENVNEDAAITVDATVGDVSVVGADSTEVKVTATRLVRVRKSENADEVLDALAVAVDRSEDGLAIRTGGLTDPEAMGCITFRVDLVIECPRTSPLKIRASEGATSVRDTGGAIAIEQTEGLVVVEHAKGAQDLTNHRGNVEVMDCAGPVKVTASHGTVALRNIYGRVDVACNEGKTVVDAPYGDVFVQNTRGDVRIIALETIGGNYEVSARDGDISIVFPPAADATIFATAENGIAKVENSAIELTGVIGKGLQKVQGVLGGGRFRVTLESHNGDVVIN